jgi:prophage regulatory protein
MLNHDRIIRKAQVLECVGMKATWLHEQVKAGKFPRPVRLGERAVGWRQSDVEAWLESREHAQ